MFSHMRQVLTKFALLALGAVLSVGGCMSNPTPHPSQFDAYSEGEVKGDSGQVAACGDDSDQDAGTAETTMGAVDVSGVEDGDAWVEDGDAWVEDGDAWVGGGEAGCQEAGPGGGGAPPADAVEG